MRGMATRGDAVIRPSGIFLAVEPIDLRCGIDRLLVLVQSVFGRDAFDGAAYVFRNRSGSRIKAVLGDATGVCCAYAACSRDASSGRVAGMRSARSTRSSSNGCARASIGSVFPYARKAWRARCDRRK